MIEKLTKKQIIELEKIKADKIKEKAKKGVKTFKKEFKKENEYSYTCCIWFLDSSCLERCYN
jgi:hypothetical protein